MAMKRFVKIACSAILFFFLFGDWDAVAASRIGDGAMVTDTVNHQKSRKKKSSQGKKNDVPVFGDTIADGRVAPVVDTTLFSPPSKSGVAGAYAPEAGADGAASGGNCMIVDEIVAVIGTKMVKLSDVEGAVESMRLSGMPVTENSRCEALESLMISNLYELQADEDSVTVSDAEVEQELEARIRYFVSQIGSREKLEEFYGKSIVQIKEEYREMIRANIVAMRMESQITQDVKVTPSEVKRFFNTLPKDSIPLVPLKYELLYITQKPIISLGERAVARQRITEIRDRIERGEQFRSRGEWASEFESMAFGLPIGTLSPVFETQYGFHVLEVLDRKGEMAHVRHILIRPEASDMDLMRAQMELDSVAQLIRDGVYTIKEAVRLFSDDAGLQGDGVYLSPMTRNPSYTSEELEPMVFLSVQDLEEGQLTNALPYMTEDNQPAFRLFYVKKRTPPHRATLTTDYDLIYDMALEKAKAEAMQEWMSNKIGDTYIRLMDRFKDCNFKYRWRSL